MKKLFLMLLVCAGLQFAEVKAAAQKVAENTVASALKKGVEAAIEEFQKDWNQCSVCLESMDPLHEHNLKCNHKLHKECMAGWAQALQRQSQAVTCPVCRAPSPSEQVELPLEQQEQLQREREARMAIANVRPMREIPAELIPLDEAIALLINSQIARMPARSELRRAARAQGQNQEEIVAPANLEEISQLLDTLNLEQLEEAREVGERIFRRRIFSPDDTEDGLYG